jgi:hypothetical protein
MEGSIFKENYKLKGSRMSKVYYYEFSPLKAFSFDVTKQLPGKIEAVLHIEIPDVEIDLKLKKPRVPADPPITAKEFFSSITPKSARSFKISGDRHVPNKISWSIEICNDSIIKIVHCDKIDGLPKEGWKKPLS